MKRIGLGVLVLVVVYVGYRQLKNEVIDWYFDNYYVRATDTPATELPDQLCLTWNGDPATTQAVNWRTSTAVTAGAVQYRLAGGGDEVWEVAASYRELADRLLENDPVNHRFTAVLEGLEPGRAYEYRVGNVDGDLWSDWQGFTTAPGATVPFSFMYLGDPQQGLDEWGVLIQAAHRRHPNMALYTIAGDLVNNGDWRNEWDEFFVAGAGIFEGIPVVPALGNHDVDDALEAEHYLSIFALPENGPAGLPAERAYTVRYSNALFVVLDSNLPAGDQAAWLEEQLAGSDATWKFAVYHHPSYSSRRARDNREIRELWGALFDGHGLDWALTGHDHAYMRTYPMRGGERAAPGEDGVIYVVSVSGTKMYPIEEKDYAEVSFEDVMTYQVIDIETNPDRLTYRAYDLEGELLDEVILEK